MDYYIVSVKHTGRRDPNITFWRPEDRGYTWALSWAGKYCPAQAMARLRYHNTGCDSTALNTEVVDALSVSPEHGTVDGDAGPVVLNNGTTWKRFIDGVIERPLYETQPEYKGARRNKQSELS